MEVFTFSFLAISLGVRHGMDADHLAAIADMIGAEKQKQRQVRLGIMYSFGHGLVVLIIGLIAISLGTYLPDGVSVALELLVGISLNLLGAMILYSLFQQKSSYEYKSRLTILYESMLKMFRKNRAESNKLSPVGIGIVGAFMIGIIHGIGVETPTQIMVITSAVGLDQFSASLMQLLLFVVGLLISTILFTYLASWGFMKAQFKHKLFLALGLITGIYSVGLGMFIIYGI